MTAGLTTARTVCRVLLRDLTGKYAWESSMLYAPPWCQEGSSIKSRSPSLLHCQISPPPSMLYAPSWCQEGSSNVTSLHPSSLISTLTDDVCVVDARALLDLSGASDLEPLLSMDDHEALQTETVRPSSEMPLYNLSLPHQDNLNDVSALSQIILPLHLYYKTIA